MIRSSRLVTSAASAPASVGGGGGLKQISARVQFLQIYTNSVFGTNSNLLAKHLYFIVGNFFHQLHMLE